MHLVLNFIFLDAGAAMEALSFGLFFCLILLSAPVFALPDSWIMHRFSYAKSQWNCYWHALVLNIISGILALWILSYRPSNTDQDTLNSVLLFQIILLVILPPASELILLRYLTPSFHFLKRIKVLLLRFGLRIFLLILLILILRYS